MPVAKGKTWTLRAMYRPSKIDNRWRCAGCGCSNRKACEEGCAWAAPRLCSRCLCTPLQLAALLAAAYGKQGVVATAEEVAAWPQVEQARANRWLQDKFNREAQGQVVRRGPKAKVEKMPSFLSKALAALPQRQRYHL